MHSPTVYLPIVSRNNHTAALHQSAKNNRRPTTTICLLKIITHTCKRSSRHFGSAHIVILFHFSITKTFFSHYAKITPIWIFAGGVFVMSPVQIKGYSDINIAGYGFLLSQTDSKERLCFHGLSGLLPLSPRLVQESV